MTLAACLTIVSVTAIAHEKRCVRCNLTADELILGELAVRVCRDWEGCCFRTHATDSAWARCRSCGEEFVIAESAFDNFCNGCTNYGVF